MNEILRPTRRSFIQGLGAAATTLALGGSAGEATLSPSTPFTAETSTASPPQEQTSSESDQASYSRHNVEHAYSDYFKIGIQTEFGSEPLSKADLKGYDSVVEACAGILLSARSRQLGKAVSESPLPIVEGHLKLLDMMQRIVNLDFTEQQLEILYDSFQETLESSSRLSKPTPTPEPTPPVPPGPPRQSA